VLEPSHIGSYYFVARHDVLSMEEPPIIALDGTYPESRVLLIITGGTICMQPSPAGLVPVDGFLKNAMAPRPSFNDMSEPSRYTPSLNLRHDILKPALATAKSRLNMKEVNRVGV